MPDGLSDDEARRFAELDAKLSGGGLDDAEAQEFGALDGRLSGGAATGPHPVAQRQEEQAQRDEYNAVTGERRFFPENAGDLARTETATGIQPGDPGTEAASAAMERDVVGPIFDPLIRARKRANDYEAATELRDEQAKAPTPPGGSIRADAPGWGATTRANFHDYMGALGGAMMAPLNVLKTPGTQEQMLGGEPGLAAQAAALPARGVAAGMGYLSEGIKVAAGERPKYGPQPIFDTSDIEPELQIAVPMALGAGAAPLIGGAFRQVFPKIGAEPGAIPPMRPNVSMESPGFRAAEAHPLGPLAPPSVRRGAGLPPEPMSLDAGGLRARVDTTGPAPRQRVQFDPTGETQPFTKPQSRIALPEPKGKVVSTEGPPVRTEGVADGARVQPPPHRTGGQELGEFDTRMKPTDFAPWQRRRIGEVPARGSPGPTRPDPFDPMQEQTARGTSQGTPTGVRGGVDFAPKPVTRIGEPAASSPSIPDFVPPKTPAAELSAAKGFVAGAAGQGRPYIETLQRLGASGREAFDRLVAAQQEHRKNAGATLQALDDATGGLSKDFKENWGHYVEGRLKPRTPEEAAALAWWKETHPQIRDTVNRSGSRVLDDDAPGGYREIGSMENFHPHKALPEIAEKIASGDAATIQTLRDLNVGKSFKDAAALDEALAKWHADSLKPTNPGTEMPRKIVMPPEWLDMSLHATETYIDSAFRSVAEQNAWKFRDPATGAPRSVGDDGRPQGDMGPLFAQIDREFPGGKREANTVVERVMGRERGTPSSRWWRSAQAIEGAGYAASRLTGPKTMVTQLGSFAPIIANAPLGDVFLGMVDAAKAPKQSYRFGVSEGAMQPPSRFGHTMGFADDPVGAVGQKATKATNALMTGVGFFDAIPRTVALRVADHLGTSLAADLRAGGNKAANAAAKMRTLRFTEQQIADAAAGKPMDMTRLRQQFVRQTSGEATMGERVPFLANPNLLWLSRGKNFGIGQAMNAWDIAAKPIRANPSSVEAYKPAAKLLVASLVMGEIVALSKDAITGPAATRPTIDEIGRKGTKALVARAFDDMREASFFGLLGDIGGTVGKGLVGEPMRLGNIVDNTTTPSVVKTGVDFARFVDGVSNSKRGKELEDEFARLLRQTFNGPVGWMDAKDSFTQDGLRERAQRTPDKDTKRAIRDRKSALDAIFRKRIGDEE